MSGAGDNVLGGVTADQLCGYVSRVERVQGEIDDLNDDKKEVFAEAKSVGFDVKVLKKVIQRRRKDRTEVQEEDDLLDTYETIISNILGKAKQETDPLA